MVDRVAREMGVARRGLYVAVSEQLADEGYGLPEGRRMGRKDESEVMQPKVRKPGLARKGAIDPESYISTAQVRGRLRFVGRGQSSQASINAIRVGPISALGADQDLVDHRDRAVAPDLKQEDLARGGDPARERRDVHLMGNQDNGFRGRQAEQDLPEFGGLPAGPVPVPEERVQRWQVVDRTEVEESGRVAAAAPLAGDDPVDGRAGGADRRPDLSRLFPAPGVEIALDGAIVEREIYGVSGPWGDDVAQDGDDAGLGQAGKARVRRCRQRGEKEGRHQGGGEKQARHRQLCEKEWRSGPAGERLAASYYIDVAIWRSVDASRIRKKEFSRV